MSSIQIVPDDVGVAAAQVISDAVGNFSLKNRLNSSDLEILGLESAKEVSNAIKDVVSVLSALNVPLTLLFYAIAIALIIWVVLTLIEKTVLVLTYFAGNKRRGRGWGRGPCSSLCMRMKRWIIGRKSSRVVHPESGVHPEFRRSRNNTGSTKPLVDTKDHLKSRIPLPEEEDL